MRRVLLRICFGLLLVGAAATCLLIFNRPTQYDYEVWLHSAGPSLIDVEEFRIYEGMGGVVPRKEISPGSVEMTQHFQKLPDRKTVTIKWKVRKTGELGEAVVELNVPETFTPGRGTTIQFLMQPSSKSVTVNYGIKPFGFTLPKLGNFFDTNPR